MNILKKVKLISLACMVAVTSFSALAKYTVIAMEPEFDKGAVQDMGESAEGMSSKLQRSLQQSLTASGKYDVKLIRDSEAEKKIREELANATTGDSIQYATTYMMDNQARFLMNAVVTAATSNRVTTEMSEDVYNYRDLGSLSVTLQIFDTGKIDAINEQDEGEGAGHQIYSNNVTIDYSTPYKRLTTSDKTHVDAQFWDEIIKEAGAQLTSMLLDTAEPMAVSDITGSVITLDRGYDTADIDEGDRFDVVDNEYTSVAEVEVTSVDSNSSKARIVNTTGSIEEGFTVQKQKESKDDGSFF